MEWQEVLRLESEPIVAAGIDTASDADGDGEVSSRARQDSTKAAAIAALTSIGSLGAPHGRLRRSRRRRQNLLRQALILQGL